MNVLILGLGNILLSDEGVGVRLVETLADRYTLPEGVEVLDGGTSGMELLDAIANRDSLIVCDAINADAEPGAILCLRDDDIPALFRQRLSPHQLGLADLLATLTLSGEAPAKMTLIGIVPADLSLSLELSGIARQALEKALAQVCDELKGLGIELTKCGLAVELDDSAA